MASVASLPKILTFRSDMRHLQNSDRASQRYTAFLDARGQVEKGGTAVCQEATLGLLSKPRGTFAWKTAVIMTSPAVVCLACGCPAWTLRIG